MAQAFGWLGRNAYKPFEVEFTPRFGGAFDSAREDIEASTDADTDHRWDGWCIDANPSIPSCDTWYVTCGCSNAGTGFRWFAYNTAAFAIAQWRFTRGKYFFN